MGISCFAISVIAIKQSYFYPGYFAILPTLGAYFVIPAGPSAFFNQKVLSSKLLVWIGLISFPLYLWHWPLLSFARIVESSTPSVSTRILAIVLAFGLAAATYHALEKPIRFGWNVKAIPLLLLLAMVCVGSVGYATFRNEGIAKRNAVKNYKDMRAELRRTQPADQACKDYIGNANPTFPYCRFQGAFGAETVAVIGDSHAHAAFPGIANALQKKNINTLLLANSGCPALVGAEYGVTSEKKALCKKQIDDIIHIVTNNRNIKKVFVITRGSEYVTGKWFGEIEMHVDGPPLIEAHIFKEALEKTSNIYLRPGKRCFM